MQGSALPQALLIKGGFGWIVDMTEDISPPPATIKKEEKPFDFSSMVGLSIEISNLFLHDLEHIIRFIEWLKKRG